MADFTPSDAKRQSIREAANFMDNLRSLYTQAKIIQGFLQRYSAASDPAFNAAINAIHTAAERTELAQMGTTINALVIDWETNHRSAIGL